MRVLGVFDQFLIYRINLGFCHESSSFKFFIYLYKVTFFANKQTQETSKSSLYIYISLHLFLRHEGEKSWTFLGSMAWKVTNKLNSCKFYQMQEAIFLIWI